MKFRARAGRPSAERVVAIDQAILEAARRNFRTAGFDNASMEAIAATAGVSKGTLYARYSTKQLLLRAVVEQQIAAWSEERSQMRGPLPKDFKQRLVYHARAIGDSLGSEEVRAFETVLRGTDGPARDLGRALYERAHQQTVEDLTQEIIEGTADYPVPPRNPARVAEMLMAMIYGWHAVHDAIRPAAADDATAYAEHAVDVIFAGRSAW